MGDNKVLTPGQFRGHTPGPWFVVGPPWNNHTPWVNAGNADPHHYQPVCDFDNRVDAETDGGTLDVVGCVDSDARLIAAAPDLLAAVSTLRAEAEAMRVQLAAAQASNRSLREAVKAYRERISVETMHAMYDALDAALSAPQDEAALRGLLVEAAMDGLDEGSGSPGDFEYGTAEYQKAWADRIVDRILNARTT